MTESPFCLLLRCTSHLRSLPFLTFLPDMAPEVILGQYNYKADIYSFGMLLWELLHVAIPFARLSSNDVVLAVQQSARPRISLPSRFEALSALISMTWHQNSEMRPDMSSVTTILLEMDIQTLERIELDVLGSGQHESSDNEISSMLPPSDHGTAKLADAVAFEPFDPSPARADDVHALG